MSDRTTVTRDLVKLALLVAIIIILAATPLGYIQLPFLPFKLTTIHIPVIIGGIMLGPVYGGVLGFLFGLTSFLSHTFNPTLTSFVFTPFYSLGDYHGNFWSLVICFVPRTLVGVFSALIYRALFKIDKNKIAAILIASIGGSMTNTILVMSGIYFFFAESYAAARNISLSAVMGVIMTTVSVNGVSEAIFAAIISLAIVKALLRQQKS